QIIVLVQHEIPAARFAGDRREMCSGRHSVGAPNELHARIAKRSDYFFSAVRRRVIRDQQLEVREALPEQGPDRSWKVAAGAIDCRQANREERTRIHVNDSAAGETARATPAPLARERPRRAGRTCSDSRLKIRRSREGPACDSMDAP